MRRVEKAVVVLMNITRLAKLTLELSYLNLWDLERSCPKMLN